MKMPDSSYNWLPLWLDLEITFTQMIQKYDPDYVALTELLESLTVAQMKDMSLTLGLRFKSGMKKAQLATLLSAILLEHPQLIIKNAFYYELKAWLDIINGNMSMEEAERSGFLFGLNRFGLVYSFNRKESNLFFQSDLAEKLKPLIPAELERREKDGSMILEQFAIGCANIYGFTDLYYLFQYMPALEEYLGKRLDEGFLNIALSPVLGLTKIRTKKTEVPMMSPFASWVDFSVDREHIDFGAKVKEYDIDTMLGFGKMPYPEIPAKCVEVLRRVLSLHGKEGRDRDEHVIRSLWLFKQNQGINNQIPDINPIFSLVSVDVAKECVEAVLDFLNHVPYWRLRGHSSREIGHKRMQVVSESRERPRIVTGANMRAMDISLWPQAEDMARRGEELPFMSLADGQKVGRNDPCPCGSGKKYKHCCGKGK